MVKTLRLYYKDQNVLYIKHLFFSNSIKVLIFYCAGDNFHILTIHLFVFIYSI